MSLDEAIKPCKEVASDKDTCKECSNEHYQLLNWLSELKELRVFKEEIINTIYK